MIPAHLKEFASFCLQSGIDRFYASPGSRSAPILLALLKAGIHIEMLGDERSAAYRALGYSLGTGRPTGIFCTSGTAALNFGPAIAEAFYQKVPLFVLTADRPPELIDQQEGQAIRQHGLFQNHTVFYATVPSFDEHPAALSHSRRIYHQALFACLGPPAGPVHLNFPIREPFYPAPYEQLIIPETPGVKFNSPEWKLPREELSLLIEEWNAAPRRLLIIGQMTPDLNLSNAVKALSEYSCSPVVGEVLNNLETIPSSVLQPDLLPDDFYNSAEARADILVTLGNNLLSKSLKKYLQANPPIQHWHIQEAGYPADAFGTLTRVVNASPDWLITKLGEASCFSAPANQEVSGKWLDHWKIPSNRIRELLDARIEDISFSDLFVTASFLKSAPEKSVICLASSMPVRYACWLYQGNKSFEFFSNRGTSGIDGCLSSAVGIAESMPGKRVFALIGDMAFLYDRNALWTNHIPGNLRILVLNNGGGNIFRMLPASSELEELENYFELKQTQTTAGACLDAGIRRLEVRKPEDWEDALRSWFDADSCTVLEVFTDKKQNHLVLKEFKALFLNVHKG